MSDKVKEIRMALESATPGPWNKEGIEVWRRGTGYHLKDDAHIWICDCFNGDNAYLISNAPEWLSYLLSELDAARQQTTDAAQTASMYLKELVECREQLDAAKREKQFWMEAAETQKNNNLAILRELDETKHDCNTWESEVNKLAQERHDLIDEVDNYKDLLFDAKQENERLRTEASATCGDCIIKEEALKQAIEHLKRIEHRATIDIAPNSPAYEIRRLAQDAFSILREEAAKDG